MSSSDIKILSPSKASITFDNLNNFILPDDGQLDFRLSIKPNIIWYQSLWKVMKDLIVSDVDFVDIVWITSDRQITGINIVDFSSEEFTISAVKPNISVLKNLNTSTQIKFNIKWDFWANQIDTSNSSPKINMQKVKISVSWTDTASAIYKMYNSDDSSDIILWSHVWWIVEFDLSILQEKNRIIWDWSWEDYIISISWINTWISANLIRNWIKYNINWINNANSINFNLKSDIDLGYRKF